MKYFLFAILFTVFIASCCTNKKECNDYIVDRGILVKLENFDKKEIEAAKAYLIDFVNNKIIDTIPFDTYYNSTYLAKPSDSLQNLMYIIKTNRTDTISDIHMGYQLEIVQCKLCDDRPQYSKSTLTVFTFLFNGNLKNGFKELVITK